MLVCTPPALCRPTATLGGGCGHVLFKYRGLGAIVYLFHHDEAPGFFVNSENRGATLLQPAVSVGASTIFCAMLVEQRVLVVSCPQRKTKVYVEIDGGGHNQ